ncbi:protein kinase family protein [Legionella yabuuchiae]|uniref:protein kinase family protein n=1 Tax=Legionella yabuuchiae TaxID=376727 RepID=UPI001056CC7E|nr:protein kinase family protein [Legionella yabuuchiae]
MPKSNRFFQSACPESSANSPAPLHRVSSHMLSRLISESSAEIIKESKSRLGRGAQGDVYLIKVKLPGEEQRWCVLKSMSDVSQAKETAINLALTEGDESSIDHNIVKIISNFKDELNEYALFPLCDTTLDRQIKTLERLQESNPESFQIIIIRLMLDLLKAVDYMHRNHVVHRDIKPENIGFHLGHWCLFDLGCSTKKDSIEPLKGTFYFSHPAGMVENSESARGYNDIYALGQTLELLLDPRAQMFYQEFFIKKPLQYLMVKGEEYSQAMANPSSSHPLSFQEQFRSLDKKDINRVLKFLTHSMTSIHPETIPDASNLIACFSELEMHLKEIIGGVRLETMYEEYKALIASAMCPEPLDTKKFIWAHTTTEIRKEPETALLIVDEENAPQKGL